MIVCEAHVVGTCNDLSLCLIPRHFASLTFLAEYHLTVNPSAAPLELVPGTNRSIDCIDAHAVNDGSDTNRVPDLNVFSATDDHLFVDQLLNRSLDYIEYVIPGVCDDLASLVDDLPLLRRLDKKLVF